MSQQSLIHRIDRPTRYLGGELGSIQKDPAQVEIQFALAFPDVYEVGMSHLGFAILYHILNARQDLAAQRVYAPWPDMEAQLRENGALLCSLEEGRALKDFDIVGLTLQYELSYTNAINMLELGGIPLRSAERTNAHPLVVMGGPCAFNPEPLADFADCVVIGDGEEAVPELCDALKASRAAGEDRPALLRRLASIEGVYVPSLYEVDYLEDGRIKTVRALPGAPSTVRRRFLKDLESAPYPDTPIVPFMQTVHNRVAMEIARGCTRGCRFCQAGYIYRPVRERSPETIAGIIERSLDRTGFDEVSLLSLSTGDYGCIEPLLKGLMERYAQEKVAVSFPSLRVGSLTPELMEEIRKVRKTGFTLAPEAGTERLRQVINKGISAEDLLETSRSAFGLGWRTIKLYFMMGLPTEGPEDLDGIVDLAAQVKRSGRGTQGGADVNVSVSTFVPKAHTPFQWEAQMGIEETVTRQRYLRDGLMKKKLRLKWHEAKMSFMEGVFARGDRRLGRVLAEAQKAGCRFDGWGEHFDFERWLGVFEACGVDPGWYLRERRQEEVLPWDHIDCGVPKSFFAAERAKAKELAATVDCRGGKCHGCGLCDFESLRMRLVERGELSLPAPDAAPAVPTDERFKVRLRLRKEGRARFVSHLEFMTFFHRACRRARLPLRFSEGFHPHPKISFPDALPTGVESDAEIIDLELFEPCSAQEVTVRLNAQFPEGIRVLEAVRLPAKTPSPAASIRETVYALALPEDTPEDLPRRIEQALAAETIPVTRLKKGKEQVLDLRKDLRDIELVGGQLRLTLAKGSPVPLAAYLLGLPEESLRALRIRKLGVRLD